MVSVLLKEMSSDSENGRDTSPRALKAQTSSERAPLTYETIDDALGKLPLILHEVEALKPALERIRNHIGPRWDALHQAVEESSREAASLRQSQDELREKYEKLWAANQKLQKRIEMYEHQNGNSGTQPASPIYDITRYGFEEEKPGAKHMVVHGEYKRQ